MLENVNEIEQNFANSKNVHEWKNILKIQKLFVTYKIYYCHKMSADSKNVGEIKNVSEFEIFFDQFPEKCSSTVEISTYSRKLILEKFTTFIKMFANSIICS